MYRFPNDKLVNRRGRAVIVGDWEHPEADGTVPFLDEPTFRQAAIHFVERLAQVAVEPAPGGARPLLTIADFRLRDKLLDALEEQGKDGEPDEIELEDAHREALVRWFERWGPQVFPGGDVVRVDAAIGRGELGKARKGPRKLGSNKESDDGDAGERDRDAAGAAGGESNDRRPVAAAQ